MLRDLLSFYFVPNGPISGRDAILKIGLPVAAVFIFAQIFPALKPFIALIFWSIVLAILITREVLKRRDPYRQPRVDDGAPKFLWLHKLIGFFITIMGFALGAATVWAIPIAVAGLAYMVIVETVRATYTRRS